MPELAKSFLGEVESRLRRLLNLQGQIPVEMLPGVRPVVIVGDGTMPGMSDKRTRSFACTDINKPALQLYVIQANEPILVDSIWLSTSAQSEFRIALADPATASPFALTVGASTMLIERAASASEVAPVSTGSSAGFANFGFELHRSTVGVNQVHQLNFGAPGGSLGGGGMHLPVGWKLNIRSWTAGNHTITVYGRIF